MGNTGWKLAAGAKATVETVDKDGDFKSRNEDGEVSGFLYRSDYVYAKVKPPKKKKKVSRAKIMKAVHAAALTAKEEGKSAPEIAKAATTAAKEAGGGPDEIKEAAAAGVKIAAGQT